jgi:hypothetical protein
MGLDFRRDAFAAFFRGEDAVKQRATIGVCHDEGQCYRRWCEQFRPALRDDRFRGIGSPRVPSAAADFTLGYFRRSLRDLCDFLEDR